MKKRLCELVVILFSLVAFGVARADIEFVGVLDYGATVTWIDSVSITPPGSTFLTPGWGRDSLATGIDTFVFAGVPSWPESLRLHGTINGLPTHRMFSYPKPDTWYWVDFSEMASVLFYGDYGVEESKPTVPLLPRLTVSPSVVTGHMTVRLQPIRTRRPVVEIHDAVGNGVRSLDCATGADGIATATWNREDESGRPVPEGVYFCRYAAADVIAVRKVLVAH
jgi:hypothetical protein